MTLSQDRLVELDAFLVELNRRSSRAILPLFRADHGLVDKNAGGAFDPVTEADKGAERAIRSAITEQYPDHGIIGEEYGEDNPDAEFVWVLDPVDGTRAFIAGLPVWTTLIGLRFQGAPILGSIGQPFLGELYIGSSYNGSGGSRLMSRGGARPLAVRACADLGQALIATTDPEGCFNPAEQRAWSALRKASRLARLGCDAYAYAMVAAGTLDLVVEAGLKAWDIEAAIPVLHGAGGRVTDWSGEPIGKTGGRMLIVGDAALAKPALDFLKTAT